MTKEAEKMPDGADRYLLDTSAIFCLKEKEAGFQEVLQIVQEAGKRGRVYSSFVSWTEYFYILYLKKGKEQAYRAVLELKRLPLQVVESNESLTLLAGEIKAGYALSFADAWVAATAQQLDAVLVHKDPEFQALSNRISLKALPFKKNRE